MLFGRPLFPHVYFLVYAVIDIYLHAILQRPLIYCLLLIYICPPPHIP